MVTSFQDDIENGFSSVNFDLQGNVENDDQRAGLEESAKNEVRRIMKRLRIGFDEARKKYTEARFKENNIDADGRPRDPKFVSFS